MKRELVDLQKIPVHMRMDYEKRNNNIIAKKPLCKRCGGTGNQFYSMYQRCEGCKGLGYKSRTLSRK